MNKKLLYVKAYRMLENCTPLKFDCGLLCDSKCCKGDENMGMVLFPGEYEVFGDKQVFLHAKPMVMAGRQKVLYAICRGNCIRKYRPLSCRIYPMVPFLDSRDRISIIEDPRAWYICPLLSDFLEIKISALFKRRIYKVFSLLCSDDDIKQHIRTVSVIIKEYSRFTGF